MRLPPIATARVAARDVTALPAPPVVPLWQPERLGREHHAEIVELLTDAFHDYPVMRHVLGDGGIHAQRLPMLLAMFVAARLFHDQPVFGVRDTAGRLLGVALCTPPEPAPVSERVEAFRIATWRVLGQAARQRYQAFVAACNASEPPLPAHHHLNMLGVRRGRQGRGIGRALLEAVQALADADPGSAGVGLTTESEPNLALYAHVGYRVVGHARVSDTLETWSLFRPGSRPIR